MATGHCQVDESECRDYLVEKHLSREAGKDDSRSPFAEDELEIGWTSIAIVVKSRWKSTICSTAYKRSTHAVLYTDHVCDAHYGRAEVIPHLWRCSLRPHSRRHRPFRTRCMRYRYSEHGRIHALEVSSTSRAMHCDAPTWAREAALPQQNRSRGVPTMKCTGVRRSGHRVRVPLAERLK
ncbi:hypothetical protein BD413DRAFT_288677 [Trametes elegans]|nr:hypothetical protein BD413DRAFT_288677 [Trametes elegans]